MAPPAEKKVEDAAPKNEELEQDAKRDANPKISGAVAFLTPDTTMNVLPSSVGTMLMSMSEGGLSQLVAGARASVGVKAGRYMFEAKIVEQTGSQKQVRVGFAAEGSLFLGEDDNSVCFDTEGFMIAHRKKSKCSQSFGRDVIVAVVLNLDDKSPNANTISLFKDGKRACPPQPLPEALKGKTLFPAVSFKNSSVHFNFAAPAVALPFKCRTISEASVKDAEVTKYAEPEEGKYTVLFPVSMPDEGSFDWLDNFLEKNPNYTELSDRSFTDWAIKSGVQSKGAKKSNDKPEQSSLEGIDQIKKVLMEVATMQPRNFVIMEVRGNLVKDDRAAAAAKFKGPQFKIVAEVIVSEPPSSFKRLIHAKALKAKQDVSDREHKAKHATEKREWAVRKRTKDAEKAKKKAAKEQKKRVEEAKLKREASLKKAQKEVAKKKAAAAGQPLPEEEEEEPIPEVEMSEDEVEPEEPEPEETTSPKVSLTAEEKAVRFFAHPTSDLTTYALATSFTKFSLPEDSEFDTVKYSWAKEKEAATYVKNWIVEKKLTTRVEDIAPSAWFKQKNSAWSSESAKWKNKVNEFKQNIAKKEQAKRVKAAAKVAAERNAKLAAEKKAAAAEKAEKEGKKVEEKEEVKAAEVVEEEEEEEEPTVDFDAVEVFGVEDVMDVGSKVPLQKEFQFEDYALMGLRFEIHLLVHSFSKDCADPDRTGIHLDHLAFYYQKYYGKPLNFGSFGVATAAELLVLLNDCLNVTKQSVIESLVPAELESNGIFAKITEAARRRRMLLLDMGDESAKLKMKQQGGGDNTPGVKRTWQESGNKSGNSGHGNGGWGGQKWGRW